MLLKNQWITEEIKEEIRKHLDTSENNNTTSTIYGTQKSSSKSEIYRNTGIPQEIRKISNK